MENHTSKSGPEIRNGTQAEADNLDRLHAQIHIIEGFRKIMRSKDIAEIICKHFDLKSAQMHLVARFDLKKTQADAILNMPLAELHELKAEEIESQYNDLTSRISALEEKESAHISSESK